MKTAIMILSIAAFALSAGAGTVRASGDSGTVTATVNNITPAMSEGEHSSISVIDEYGGPIIFDITPTTAITDSANKPIKLGDIQQNDTVEIEYTDLAGGLGVAKSIKFTEQSLDQ